MNGMDGRQRLLLAVMLLITSALVFLFLADGLVAASLLGAILLAALWITKGVWSPDETQATKIATATLSLVATVAAGYFKLATHTREDLAGLADIGFGQANIGVLALVILALGAIGVVGYISSGMPSVGTRHAPLDARLREKTFPEQLQGFCRTLAAELNTINVSTLWSSEWYVPVEAEVEIVRAGRRSRRLGDMLTAIRRNANDTLFVVLGDPGAGKSVALRVLCEQLLPEVIRRRGKVPIYVNLKEWTPAQTWTRENPPTLSDLKAFMYKNLEHRLAAFGIEFLANYYERMLNNGQFFFVFDSFDEIPALLDVDESSWLIRELSSIFEAFFFGGPEIRGIVSSRYFRRPRIASTRRVCTLEIRPFSEFKIRASLERANISSALIERMFRERRDLVPLARNPFMAGLIIDFMKNPRIVGDNTSALPRSQRELYESCIRRRLALVGDSIHEYGLDESEVMDRAVDIAGLMFKASDIGLEISVRTVRRDLAGPTTDDAGSVLNAAHRIEDTIEVLVAGRIGRRSGGAVLGRFSFVHRRFNEYFFVRYLLRERIVPSLEAIPLDSKWRDALVLYSEVCSDDEAIAIASFCWEEMRAAMPMNGKDEQQYLRYVHCLRFLGDAFYSRPAAIAKFVDALFIQIGQTVEHDENLMMKVIAVESAGLLSPLQIETVIRSALKLSNAWLSESAFNACRYIGRVSPRIEFGISAFLAQLTIDEVRRRYSEIRFSMELSPGMRRLRVFWRGRAIDCLAYLLALIGAVVVPPVLIATTFA